MVSFTTYGITRISKIEYLIDISRNNRDEIPEFAGAMLLGRHRASEIEEWLAISSRSRADLNKQIVMFEETIGER